MSEQLHSVHDVSAQGDLHLTEPNGDHVTLEVALAFRPPTDARVQAWKFGQVVFDLTATRDGVWLLAGDSRAEKLQVSTSQMARSLALLSGKLLDEPELSLHDEGTNLILTRHDPGEPIIHCLIDRATRTIRQYQLLDDQQVVRFSLKQSQFVEHDGLAWPQRILASGDSGVIDISLHDVELNAGLPATAFVPPHRAKLLP